MDINVTMVRVHEMLEGAQCATMITDKGVMMIGDAEQTVRAFAKSLNDEQFARTVWGALVQNGHTSKPFPSGSEVDK